MYPDVATAQRFTLVVGAGINANRRVPGWSALVRRAWSEVFGAEADYRLEPTQRLAEARAAVQTLHGWTDAETQRLDIPIHPLEPQMALELIDLKLHESSDAADRVRRLVTETRPRVQLRGPRTDDLLPALLARCLYEHVRRDGTADTLSELARFIGRSKRLVRVISLNVDNLLELEVERATPGRLEVITRQRHRPGSGIPTYHLHGFLPVNTLADVPRWARNKRGAGASRRKTSQMREHMTEAVPEGLVFTDAQYWQSVATPLSFANFVFANALHDSSCIFIGLSMTDLNIVRWLGLHAAEFRHEYEREFALMEMANRRAPNPYFRHCWIRADSADPTGLVKSFLATRGVYTEPLQDWGVKSLRTVMRELLRYEG